MTSVTVLLAIGGASGAARAGSFAGTLGAGGLADTVHRVEGSASILRHATTVELRLAFLAPNAAVEVTVELSAFGESGGSPRALYHEYGTELVLTEVLGDVAVTPGDCPCQLAGLWLRFVGPSGEQREIAGAIRDDGWRCKTAQAGITRLYLAPPILRETACPIEPPAPPPAPDPWTDHEPPLPDWPPAPAPTYHHDEGGCGGDDDYYDDGGCELDDGGGSSWDDGGGSGGGCEGDSGGGGCESDSSGGGCESDGDWGGDSGGCEGDSSDSSCEGDDDWGAAHAAIGRTGRRGRGRSARRGPRLPPIGFTLPYILVGLLVVHRLRPRRRRGHRLPRPGLAAGDAVRDGAQPATAVASSARPVPSSTISCGELSSVTVPRHRASSASSGAR